MTMASHKRRREPNEFAQQDAAGRSGLIFEPVAQATSVMEAEFNARKEPRRADTSLERDEEKWEPLFRSSSRAKLLI